MITPCLEVTVAKVGNSTVEDESSPVGIKYMTAFYNGATGIPGCTRGAWGRSDKYSDTVVHFLDYNSRKEHDVHKALIGGPAPPILDGLQYDTAVYVIHPTLADRSKIYFSPYISVTFFWGIEDERWGPATKKLFAAVERCEASTGLFWGEIDKPVLSDPHGFNELGSGKCAIAVARRKSMELHDAAQSEIAEALGKMEALCKMVDDWGTLTVMEQTGHIHSWRTPLPADEVPSRYDHGSKLCISLLSASVC